MFHTRDNQTAPPIRTLYQTSAVMGQVLARGRECILGRLALVALGLLGAACGSSSPTEPAMPAIGGPSPQAARVTFTYTAPTAIDPAVDYSTCSPSQVIFSTHLHFVWNGWNDRRDMTPVGSDLFELSELVPVDQDLHIALHDPNVCLQGDVYVAPTALSANGVLLTQVVSVVDGTGLSFRVSADGSITP